MAALRQHIAHSPLSQRKIEERVGFARGYLSQVLTGRIDLKIAHLLRVLDTLALPPGRFFAQLHPRPDRQALDALRARARRHEQPAPMKRDRVRDIEALGVESPTDLRRRLERCEQVIAQLETLGIVATLPPPRRVGSRSAGDD